MGNVIASSNTRLHDSKPEQTMNCLRSLLYPSRRLPTFPGIHQCGHARAASSQTHSPSSQNPSWIPSQAQKPLLPTSPHKPHPAQKSLSKIPSQSTHFSASPRNSQSTQAHTYTPSKKDPWTPPAPSRPPQPRPPRASVALLVLVVVVVLVRWVGFSARHGRTRARDYCTVVSGLVALGLEVRTCMELGNVKCE